MLHRLRHTRARALAINYPRICHPNHSLIALWTALVILFQPWNLTSYISPGSTRPSTSRQGNAPTSSKTVGSRRARPVWYLGSRLGCLIIDAKPLGTWNTCVRIGRADRIGCCGRRWTVLCGGSRQGWWSGKGWDYGQAGFPVHQV